MLYQEVRPSKFEDMIGNVEQVKALSNALSSPNHAHVYMMTGPSGCGKTTAARIAAGILGADPLSITEINAADDRGIDTARMIIDKVRYGGLGASGIMVFIIDEAHKTTKEFQNAMLKVLEDVPKHVYFFICTTEPNKLISTIKTRCEPIKFAALTQTELKTLVQNVNRDRNLGVCKEALGLIAENCDQSARLALVQLQKIANLPDPAEQVRLVKSGVPDEEAPEIIEFCRVLMRGKSWPEVAAVIKKLDVSDPENIRYAVLGYMNSVVLNSGDRRAALALEFFSEPFYNSLKAGVTLAAYQTLNAE